MSGDPLEKKAEELSQEAEELTSKDMDAVAGGAEPAGNKSKLPIRPAEPIND